MKMSCVDSSWLLVGVNKGDGKRRATLPPGAALSSGRWEAFEGAAWRDELINNTIGNEGVNQDSLVDIAELIGNILGAPARVRVPLLVGAKGSIENLSLIHI